MLAQLCWPPSGQRPTVVSSGEQLWYKSEFRVCCVDTKLKTCSPPHSSPFLQSPQPGPDGPGRPGQEGGPSTANTLWLRAIFNTRFGPTIGQLEEDRKRPLWPASLLPCPGSRGHRAAARRVVSSWLPALPVRRPVAALPVSWQRHREEGSGQGRAPSWL